MLGFYVTRAIGLLVFVGLVKLFGDFFQPPAGAASSVHSIMQEYERIRLPEGVRQQREALIRKSQYHLVSREYQTDLEDALLFQQIDMALRQSGWTSTGQRQVHDAFSGVRTNVHGYCKPPRYTLDVLVVQRAHRQERDGLALAMRGYRLADIQCPPEKLP